MIETQSDWENLNEKKKNGLKKERYRRNMLENVVADCPRIIEIPEMIRNDVWTRKLNGQ